MNRLLKFVGRILEIFTVLWDIVEFLAVPVLFVIIGLLNRFPWQYYAVTIGGYVALFVIAEIIAYFVFKALDKKYTPLLQRKLEKYFNRFSNKD